MVYNDSIRRDKFQNRLYLHNSSNKLRQTKNQKSCFKVGNMKETTKFKKEKTESVQNQYILILILSKRRSLLDCSEPFCVQLGPSYS